METLVRGFVVANDFIRMLTKRSVQSDHVALLLMVWTEGSVSSTEFNVALGNAGTDLFDAAVSYSSMGR
ncbi:MAG: hypothetical protein MRJ68_16165 [Nitrospira sp.]|nr:hypothetical protein [Nitrospira sp.]